MTAFRRQPGAGPRRFTGADLSGPSRRSNWQARCRHASAVAQLVRDVYQVQTLSAERELQHAPAGGAVKQTRYQRLDGGPVQTLGRLVEHERIPRHGPRAPAPCCGPSLGLRSQEERRRRRRRVRGAATRRTTGPATTATAASPIIGASPIREYTVSPVRSATSWVITAGAPREL